MVGVLEAIVQVVDVYWVVKPITCAGVVVRPGDYAVADDDGVVVVPQHIADEVADRAVRIQEADRPSRRDGYRKLGLPFDETVA